MHNRSFLWRRLGRAVLAIAIVVVASDADAGLKPHCRRLIISGNAGATPNQATFQILDKNSNTLAQSCAVQPWNNETAIDYIKRLIYRWVPDPTNADLDADECTPIPPINDPAALALLEPLPSKGCVTLAGPDQPSCTIKYKIAPKDAGTKKQYLEFCCYEDNDEDKLCKTKLDPDASPKPIPITVQVDTNGDLIYCPPTPCDGNCAECPIVDISPPMTFGMRGPVEPLLGTKHLPSSEGGGCRAEIGAALATYARMGASTLSRCHSDRLVGKILPTTDCNAIPSTDPKTDEMFSQLGAILHEAANECASGGSPNAAGYTSCPAPCNGIDLGVCSAGTVGAPCATDAACDVVPGDGRCGDWAAMGDCLECIAKDAILTSATTVYGAVPPPPVDPSTAKCQEGIGRALTDLTRARVAETISCQKKTDGGAALPAGALVCKEADGKQKVAGAETRSRGLVSQYCDGGELAIIGSTCGGSTDPIAVGDCIVENAFAVNDALSYLAFPETTPVCGDGVKEGDEECDGDDDATCPGACLSACRCGVLSPVNGALTPCEPSVIDRYTFDVSAGDQIVVQADTVAIGSAADLCFGFDSGCTSGDGISGDEEVPCSFPSPLAFGCPQDAFVASADGVCTVEVTDCVSDCADSGTAGYTFTVTRDLAPAAVELVDDDEPDGP